MPPQLGHSLYLPFSGSTTSSNQILAIARLLVAAPLQRHASSAFFSTTAPLESRRRPGGKSKITKQRRIMFSWLKKHGRNYKLPSKEFAYTREDRMLFSNLEGEQPDSSRVISRRGPQYVSREKDHPFPMNKLFFSEPVLDDASRDLIYQKVVKEGRSIKAVSATYGVDIRRVAAVVRLKAVEKQWLEAKKPLARIYAQAMFSMLPTSHLEGSEKPHESINDVHAHRYTMQQLFLPVSESKKFTREDAARAFHRDLLPADKRIPIPELVQFEKDKLQGKSLKESMRRLVTDTAEMEQKLADKIRAQAEREARRVAKVESDRFQFRFQNFEVEDVGKTGRSKRGTGWRYGVPLYDRQKGHSREVPEKVGM